jgi:hypothetical protein
MMGSVQKEDNVLLWCDNLQKEKSTRKCKGKSAAIDSYDSDDDPLSKHKN